MGHLFVRELLPARSPSLGWCADRTRKPPGACRPDGPRGQYRRLLHRGCWRSTVLHFPEFDAKPRIFTWWSIRPWNSMFPSGRNRHQIAGAIERSPGRGADGVLEGAPRWSGPGGGGSRGPGRSRRCRFPRVRPSEPAVEVPVEHVHLSVLDTDAPIGGMVRPGLAFGSEVAQLVLRLDRKI